MNEGPVEEMAQRRRILAAILSRYPETGAKLGRPVGEFLFDDLGCTLRVLEILLYPLELRLGRFPTDEDARGEMGDTLFDNLTQYFHGPGWTSLLPVVGRSSTRYWKEANGFEFLAMWLTPKVAARGEMPTKRELLKSDISFVTNAIDREFGCLQVVTARLGLPVVNAKLPAGFWDSFENMASVLIPIAAEFVTCHPPGI